jgi:NAD(P)-dependent dehydrogenase (short-subunit alcohol dehydrogenase family)
MKIFRGKTAIITGGGSGIGRAVGQELARHGAEVVLADINAEHAGQAAEEIGRAGGQAVAAVLDVTDAGAVKALVEQTAARRGRLDYMFNNAGIAIVGEARDHDMQDWYQTLEVNLRGVVHGVQAAYPLMVEQGTGHIVNTASLAGLIPAVNEVAYVAAKHAVVGLSTTLRAEAADFGVKVSVVCPGYVDTPILFENLRLRHPGREFASRQEIKDFIPFKAMPVEAAAREIARGVARNKAIIPITRHAKVLWWLYRLSPGVSIRLGRRVMREIRKDKTQAPPPGAGPK